MKTRVRPVHIFQFALACNAAAVLLNGRCVALFLFGGRLDPNWLNGFLGVNWCFYSEFVLAFIGLLGTGFIALWCDAKPLSKLENKMKICGLLLGWLLFIHPLALLFLLGALGFNLD